MAENKEENQNSGSDNVGKGAKDPFNVDEFNLNDGAKSGDKTAGVNVNRNIRQMVDPFSQENLFGGMEEIITKEASPYDQDTTQHLKAKGFLPNVVSRFRRKQIQKGPSYDIFKITEEKSSLKDQWGDLMQKGKVLDSLDALNKLFNGPLVYYFSTSNDITGKKLEVIIKSTENAVNVGNQQQEALDSYLANIDKLCEKYRNNHEGYLMDYHAALEAMDHAKTQIPKKNEELEKRMEEAEQGKISLSDLARYKAGIEKEINDYKTTIKRAESRKKLIMFKGVSNKSMLVKFDETKDLVENIRSAYEASMSVGETCVDFLKDILDLVRDGGLAKIPGMKTQIEKIKTDFNSYYDVFNKYLKTLNSSLQYDIEKQAPSSK